jgi:hypothetical protein
MAIPKGTCITFQIGKGDYTMHVIAPGAENFSWQLIK